MYWYTRPYTQARKHVHSRHVCSCQKFAGSLWAAIFVSYSISNTWTPCTQAHKGVDGRHLPTACVQSLVLVIFMSDGGRCTSIPAAPSKNGAVGINVLTGDQLLWLRNSLLLIASAVTPSKKSSVDTNRKSTTHFQVSLRCILYIAPKPPFGGSKPQNGHFPCEIALCLKKVCYKFEVYLYENHQRHSCKPFIGLSICG